MPTARPVGAAALAITLLGAGLALLAVPAFAQAPITCQGKAATVVGTTGTEGDDVMVVVPIEGTIAQALGGNDTICIVAAPEDGTRSVVVDAGPGNDTVVNESADVDDVWYTTILGPGADSYVGLDAVIPDDSSASPFDETVYAGARDLTKSGLQGSKDTEVDTIDTRGGDDVVFSGTTALATSDNNDTVSTGPGDDTVSWAGEQGTSALDLGEGTNTLALHTGFAGTAVTVDAGKRTATADGRTVLQWTGAVTRYDLSLGNRDQTFVGTDADEVLVVTPPEGSTVATAVQGVRDVSMGAGADEVLLDSMGSGTIDGGPGRDSWSGTSCTTADIRIGGTFSCETGSTPLTHAFDFDGFEDLLVRGGDVTVVGTGRPEKIKVVAARIRVRALGGADVVNANAWGRPSGDRPVVLSGGSGPDRLVGTRVRDRLLGGRGDDKLFGEGRGDTLVGGPGRDRTFGQQGRDRCSGEVQRSCER